MSRGQACEGRRKTGSDRCVYPPRYPEFSPMLPVPSLICVLHVESKSGLLRGFNNDPGLVVSSDHPGHGPCRIHHRRAIGLFLSRRLHRLRFSRVPSHVLSQHSPLVVFVPLLSPLDLSLPL